MSIEKYNYMSEPSLSTLLIISGDIQKQLAIERKKKEKCAPQMSLYLSSQILISGFRVIVTVHAKGC